MDNKAKIQNFTKLEKGWNGYNADPPSAACILTSLEIYELSQYYPPNRVVPSVIGGIGFYWPDIYVEVLNDGHIQAVFGTTRQNVEDLLIKTYFVSYKDKIRATFKVVEHVKLWKELNSYIT